MGFFNKYPHTDFHELNLDWVIERIKAHEVELKNFILINTVKYHDPILWDITSQYEANTVVVDSTTGDAYISTHPVPTGVDIHRTDYWTAIFNYGGQVSDIINRLEDEIETRAENDVRLLADIEAEASARVEAVNNLSEVINEEITVRTYDIERLNVKLNDEKSAREQVDEELRAQLERVEDKLIVHVGDSYGLGWTGSGAIHTPYCTLASQYTGYTLYNSSESGAGFVSIGEGGHNYKGLLNLIDVTVDKSKVTDVFFMGGYNDRTASEQLIESAMVEAIAEAKRLYPNAEIHVGFLGWSNYAPAYDNLAKACIVYKRCAKYGASYMAGIEIALHDMLLFDVDGFHPNQNGHVEIGTGMANYLKNGTAIVYERPRREIEPVGVGSIAFGGKIQQQLNGDILSYGWYNTLYINGLSSLGEKVLNGVERLVVGNVPKTGYGVGYWDMNNTYSAIYHMSDGTLIPGNCRVNVVNGEIAIFMTVPNNEGGWLSGTILDISIPAQRHSIIAMNN